MNLIKSIVLLLICVAFSCNSAKKPSNDFSKIISRQFMGSDSLVININYRVWKGCLGYSRGRIKIKTYHDKFHFFHEYFGDNYAVEVFEGRKENIIKKLEQLEVNSKKSIKSCGGTSGGTAYHFNMCIDNSEETEFGYCKSEYDGLAYFLSRMRNLKTKEIFIKN